MYRFYEQALRTLQNNSCRLGDIVQPFNEVVIKDGVSPTITTRPDGLKTSILPVVEEKNMADSNDLEQKENKAKKPKYSIRKLTPREVWRLMNFSDADFEKAQTVNSNSQLYKQAGNSIVVACLCAIFSQLGIQGRKRWNEMSVEERRALVYKGTVLEGK